MITQQASCLPSHRLIWGLLDAINEVILFLSLDASLVDPPLFPRSPMPFDSSTVRRRFQNGAPPAFFSSFYREATEIYIWAGRRGCDVCATTNLNFGL